MHTIELKLNDELYQNIVDNNINIQDRFKDFLHALVDDGHPSISFDEAQKRVKSAIDEYQNKKATVTALNDSYWNDLENKIKNL